MNVCVGKFCLQNMYGYEMYSILCPSSVVLTTTSCLAMLRHYTPSLDSMILEGVKLKMIMNY